MRLNTLKPGLGSKRPRLRVGRGASAGQGKTCGRGVKGQRARKGGYHKVGFEGGQTPLDRRLPKFGFISEMQRTRAEVRLSELDKVEGAIIDIESLKKAGVIPVFAERAKVVLSGEVKKAVTLKGVGATKGARAAIEAAGGTIEAPEVDPADVPKPRDPVKRAKAEAAQAKADAEAQAKSDAKAAKVDTQAAKDEAKAAKASARAAKAEAGPGPKGGKA
ncbi:MAG: large subunit ribosomal protein [Gammaproteobacteria bacterium]|jgi:large subunit ribosomal protein L15|nr:large subunit ribosomal protein [Gammaproteobacteria bacterium]